MLDLPKGNHIIKIGVFGASGTTGTELCNVLTRHPSCEVVFATSREFANRSLKVVDPAAPDLVLTHPDDVNLDQIDCAFVCLPHGASATTALRCFEANLRVIDLSGDLRLKDGQLHEKTYGSERSEKLAQTAIYGLTELNRKTIKSARVVTNPGCYPTCSLLALAPLAGQQSLGKFISINAVSGVSGAGRSANARTHFCAAVDDVRPYSLGRTHRHTVEIEQGLANLIASDSKKPPLMFSPHLVPLERGMLATVTLHGVDMTTNALHTLFASFYKNEPFVDVLPPGEHARIRGVARSNRAAIGIHAEPDQQTVIITSAIDNLLKGAAGQAVQNMNLMYEFNETSGLL